MADVAIDATALGGLANLHASRLVHFAQSAAATSAIVAHRTIDTGAAQRSSGHRVGAGAERCTRGNYADAATTFIITRAGVAFLRAVRRRAAVTTRVAERRAALGVAATWITIGLARRVERDATTSHARSATAFAALGARRVIGDTLLVRAYLVNTAHRTALGARRARRTGHRARRGIGRARTLRIANLRAAFAAASARCTESAAYVVGVAGTTAVPSTACDPYDKEHRSEPKANPHRPPL